MPLSPSDECRGATAWELARSGDFRGGADEARRALREPGASAGQVVDLHLAAGFCAMRQGHHDVALRELDAAQRAIDASGVDPRWALRVAAWRAELAYFQGRYSDAETIGSTVTDALEGAGEHAYAAFALRTQIAIRLARADYAAIAATAGRAIALAERGGDDYVIVQIYNVLGAASFDRATSKLDAPHARAHLSALERSETAPMEEDTREALRLFVRARDVALRAGYQFAAWYVSGNIERLEIVLGHADRAVRAIRKRLRVLQARGAAYDEIVTRSNLAWGLRTLARHREALHELDVALDMVRATGTFNVLLEFLEYDRSIVLDALGETAGARASYRRYLQLIGARDGGAVRGRDLRSDVQSGTGKRPLEPFYLKRADRFVRENLEQSFTVSELAAHCGVSARLLQKAFADFRGIPPVAYIRDLRLAHALRLLEAGAGVADAARHCGFRSPTTFTLEFRRRYGVAPSRAKRGSAERRRAASA